MTKQRTIDIRNKLQFIYLLHYSWTCKWHHILPGSPVEKWIWGVGSGKDGWINKQYFNGSFYFVNSVANLSSFTCGWLWISWCVCFVYRLWLSHLLRSCRRSSWHPAFVGEVAVTQVRSHPLIAGGNKEDIKGVCHFTSSRAQFFVFHLNVCSRGETERRQQSDSAMLLRSAGGSLVCSGLRKTYARVSHTAAHTTDTLTRSANLWEASKIWMLSCWTESLQKDESISKILIKEKCLIKLYYMGDALRRDHQEPGNQLQFELCGLWLIFSMIPIIHSMPTVQNSIFTSDSLLLLILLMVEVKKCYFVEF